MVKGSRVRLQVTTKRFAVYAAVAIVLALLVPIVVFAVADLLVHQTKHAVNIWGYRGPIVGTKQPGEWRLAVLGESTAYGYGVKTGETFPAYVEERLNEAARGNPPVEVLNLAYNNEGAYSYQFTLRDYDYLQYDAVLFYSGYNDLGGANTSVFRHESPIFRWTGYLPLLPFLLHEKAWQLEMRWGGSGPGGKTLFEPDLAERATIATLEQASKISRSLEAQLGNDAVPVPPVDATSRLGVACGWRWSHYCGGMYLAVKMALDRGLRVLVVTQPYYNEAHRDQQRHLREFLEQRFGGTGRLRFADLGEVVPLGDRSLCFDGLHLTALGNRRIADALVPYVRGLLPATSAAALDFPERDDRR